MSGGVDYQGDNVPKDFYVPTPDPEQSEQEQQERVLNAAQLSIVEEVVADFKELFDAVDSVGSINTELFSTVSAEAQVLGLQFGATFAANKYDKYKKMFIKKQDSLKVEHES